MNSSQAMHPVVRALRGVVATLLSVEGVATLCEVSLLARLHACTPARLPQVKSSDLTATDRSEQAFSVHNLELITLIKLNQQLASNLYWKCSELALQDRLGTLATKVVACSVFNWLTDCLTPFPCPFLPFLGAINSINSTIKQTNALKTHNSLLMGQSHLACRTAGYLRHVTAVIDLLLWNLHCSNSAQNAVSICTSALSHKTICHLAFLPYCISRHNWVGNEKGTFSVFNLKETRTYGERKVNRTFLAAALRKCGIDFLIAICYLQSFFRILTNALVCCALSQNNTSALSSAIFQVFFLFPESEVLS